MMGPGLLSPLWVLLFCLAGSAAAAFNLTSIPFNEGYSPLFGEGNIVRSTDDRSLSLVLNPYSGSGFISSDMYYHGFFSASIKLPSDYTAGVVVAFYTSNNDVFEKNHDELDFEFLGNILGKQWRVQTNVYGNGSTNRGREERYLLPFDPTKEAHRYSILWTADTIIFFIDDTPIREVPRRDAMGGDYPSKPMSIYATIWDASSWATSGGKYRVNYKYGPFVSEFSDLVLIGHRTDPIQQMVAENDAELESIKDIAVMTAEKRKAMREFRERYMIYSNCYDTLRYPITLPDCNIVASEMQRFRETGHLKFSGHRHRRTRRRSRIPTAADPKRQASM